VLSFTGHSVTAGNELSSTGCMPLMFILVHCCFTVAVHVDDGDIHNAVVKSARQHVLRRATVIGGGMCEGIVD
jgi:hypothetical protein